MFPISGHIPAFWPGSCSLLVPVVWWHFRALVTSTICSHVPAFLSHKRYEVTFPLSCHINGMKSRSPFLVMFTLCSSHALALWSRDAVYSHVQVVFPLFVTLTFPFSGHVFVIWSHFVCAVRMCACVRACVCVCLCACVCGYVLSLIHI